MDFISKARVIHGNRYGYDFVNYLSSKKKVEIICSVHGSFEQTPSNHLSGRGCPKCKFDKISQCNRLTLEDFFTKAKIAHADKYDYSQVILLNSKMPIKIICPVHGLFEQTPSNHFRFGCKQCAYEASGEKQTKHVDTFIEQARKVHGLKYDYKEYNGAHEKCCITCPTHGDFLQSAHSHLAGRGCPQCKQGVNHPRYGKCSQPAGYYGTYKGTIFRSLPELFFMLKCEKETVKYLGIDQKNRRDKWQVEIILNGKPATYCGDFFLEKTNEVIDIKPLWRQRIQQDKLEMGKLAYETKGYQFITLNSDTIKISKSKFKKMVDNREIQLLGKAVDRFNKRFR